MSYLFVLISEASGVSQSDLFRLKGALEANAAHCAAAWRLEAPAIEVIDKRSRMPAGCQPIVFLDDGGDAGTLADHYYDPMVGPACRVYTQNSSALNSGPYSVSEAASHEVLEAMVNPRLNLWVDHPTRHGVQMPVEVCDPTQDEYRIDAGGTSWAVSNFVTPQYYDPRFSNAGAVSSLLAQGGGLDFLHRLRKAGELSSEGYTVLRSAGSYGGRKTWAEDNYGVMTSAKRKSWRGHELGVRF